MAAVKKCRHSREEWDHCTCQWYWDHRINGKRTYTPIAAKDAVPGGRDGTFAADAEAWLEPYEGGRHNTYVTYRGYVKRLNGMFGEWRTRDIDGPTLDAFSRDAEKHLASTTAAQLHGVLVRIIQSTGATVPHHVAPKPGKPKRRTPVTTGEVKRIISALPASQQPLATFAALTGMRLGEMLGLKPEDVDGDLIWVRRQRGDMQRTWAPKTESGTRPVVLGPVAMEIVKAREGEDWVFPTSSTNAQYHMRNALRRVGLWEPGMGYHTLRHYNASLRERVGQGLRGAQGELGHSSTSQTLGYGWGERSPEAAAQMEGYFQE
jgi:integrase